MTTTTELVAYGGGTALFTALAWFALKNREQNIEKLKNAPDLNINKDLKDVLRETQDQSLPYAVIKGKVAAVGEALKSEFVPGMLGVMQRIIQTEHKTVWDKDTQQWRDSRKCFRDAAKVIPFSLKGEDASVIVVEHHKAEGLTMQTVYNKFSPVHYSFGDSLVSFATGEKTKGYQDTESLLRVGTVLTGIGKLTLEKDEILLGPPTGSGDYILSALNKSQVMKKMDDQRQFWKVLMYISGTFTAVIAVACLWEWFTEYRKRRLLRQQREEIRRGRQKTNSDSGQGVLTENHNTDLCVICVTNPREVVILNCGHMCACADCATALHPPLCPICRGRIVRINPVFNS